MPNWVTNKVSAPSHVIASIVSADDGRVDFERIVKFEGEFPWGGVYGDAETMAEVVVGTPFSSNPLLGSLEAANRARADIKKLNDESFEQFIQMLRNFRKVGFLHSMDFARAKWGTKWNACDSSADIEAGTAEFDTAWSCPVPIFEALSRKFPEDVITVTYADEDIGSNCGTFSMRNGEEISSEIAPSWHDMTDAERAKWKAFACEVTGRDPKDYEDEEA
ncbi:hypothetical protein [Burkholderia cenocepacia]|uniref:DUF1281 family ferredoxin-like fold protein n=1 Tax=Burkholderia cenocepacia TaxID=95486 RepID=UPI002018A4BE|nr:hypothetical protein [Burkholderia cenocepacia]MCO1396388.1 hypothetical protein [Burkholderia cenocepacia]MCO1408962.1 hypothetical protein [Burkholderia cenocepacia]UQN92063.1 hypothetical protein L0Z06_15185 [Burkholderia cenocepacia]UQN99212.1 hypothetical protein L0Z39_16975 [Burkholderia cenocepacia]UQP50833.1 hypothetical protein L0Y99_10270 [Burkholderia cenocepacia]